MSALPRSFRQVFDANACILKELRTVGRVRLSQARVPGLMGHVHPDAFEIFLLERGEAQWWVEEEVHHLVAGHVYLNRPGERHGSMGASLRPCGYCWVQLAVRGSKFPGMSASQSLRIVRALSDPRVRSFPVPPAVAEHFVKLWEIHVAPGPDAEIRARAHLHLLLAELACYAEKCTATRAPTFAVRKVLRFIDNDPGADHPIAKLAALAGLGETQFRKRFLAETGLNPADYVRRHRIELAKKRLQEGGESITRIATELGFGSSQHFATAFKKLEGVKPSEFLRGLG